MADRPYLSIGEVLALLRPEFPDLTISKIRFLESQGLLDPERTPSGYRKFYDADVDRLRWILHQQKEQYLPLKVIKGRLGTDELDDDADGSSPVAVAVTVGANDAGVDGTEDAGGSSPSPAGTSSGVPAQPTRRQQVPVTALAVAPSPPSPVADEVNPLQVVRTGVSMTLDELGQASGLKPDELRELERFGLLAGRPVAGTTYYDEEALIVANLAAGFIRFGVEARHLRMYKTAAEREAGFFEQLVMPLLKQRNPRSRRQAMDMLVEMSKLGQGMRAAMLRAALRDHTGGS
ncbi:MAG TPA: MerR family transcriptional regulator [Acidimicrobiales bacterium]